MPLDDPLSDAAREMRDLQATGHVVPLALDPLSALQLAGLLQLTQRHPGLPDSHRALAQDLVALIREAFVGMPSISELIRRGDDPTFDVDDAAAAPRITLS